MKMGSCTIVNHQGKDVVIVDVSHCTPEESRAVYADAINKITKMPPKSVLVITDSTGAVYNSESSETTKNYSASISPHVKASAVVGADNMKKIMISTLRMVTKRDIKTFDTREQALDWLVGL
jgi:hypothetical protein